MKSFRSWRWLLRRRSAYTDSGKCGLKILRQLPFLVLCIVMLYIVYRTTTYQHEQTEMEERLDPFGTIEEFRLSSKSLRGLPRGIIHSHSDLEKRPLWGGGNLKLKAPTNHNLLAIAVGIKQKRNVDAIVQKFLPENFTVMLFHYDGNVDGWRDLRWNNEAIHIVAQNQTKWWFAKRFLHPDIVSIYDYIFLWDEDLEVENFHPGRYLQIVRSEGFEISQPALDPNSTEIHHRITVRSRSKKFHTRVYHTRGHTKCTRKSEGPPCSGFVEGMAPVFSRSAWLCAWHLIQNDLVHGWGIDMRFGYCAQGDRTKRVGIIDREYVVHKGIQTLGGDGKTPMKKNPNANESNKRNGADIRAEIRRQSRWEHHIFRDRWNRAVREDKEWIDPYKNWIDTYTTEKDKSWTDPVKTERKLKKTRRHNY